MPPRPPLVPDYKQFRENMEKWRRLVDGERPYDWSIDGL